MKRLLLLGASGSIGLQTVDVVSHHRNEFCIIGLSVGYQIDKLHELLKQLPEVKRVCVAESEQLASLQKLYPDILFEAGESGLAALCAWDEYDVLVNALVGFRGLIPTLTAIQNDKDVALANKESLVVGGELIKAELEKHSSKLYPIDSEHSAIFQCLKGNEHRAVDKLIITASGGSFRDYTREQLQHVSVKQALSHPNWSMGSRITIDSATMMNKGFEVIEAHYLFDIPYSDITTLIHRESIVHSMVQFKDHAILAQLGTPDMRIPIQYALTYPQREKIYDSEPLDFNKLSTLHFQPTDLKRYPLLKTAYEVGARKGNSGAIMNGADEAAVAHFLAGRISFLDIEAAVQGALEHIEYVANATLSDLIDADRNARTYVDAFAERKHL